MRRALLVAVLAVALFAGNAAAHPLSKHGVPVAAPLLHMIVWHRGQTWHYQDLLGRSRTPTRYAERRTESVEYRTWQVGLWRDRHMKARKDWNVLLGSWRAQERSIYRATRASASFWNVSYSWLLSCARSEGFIGGQIIWSDNWAGAGGPWQYLDGTFSWMSNAAWSAAARRGVRIPLVFKRKSSMVGQAWTTGWAFRNGHSGHWYGSGC